MSHRVHSPPNLIFALGTQVVALRNVVGPNGRTLHPRGAVGVVVKSPTDLNHAYRIRFPDGVEESLHSADLTSLAKFKEGDIGDASLVAPGSELLRRVILQCIIGSQAYGLADGESDIDRRGIYLPSAELHWSLYGVPEQLECHQTREAYWEIQKFLVLALKANPIVLECLYSPFVEKATPLAREILDLTRRSNRIRIHCCSRRSAERTFTASRRPIRISTCAACTCCRWPRSWGSKEAAKPWRNRAFTTGWRSTWSRTTR